MGMSKVVQNAHPAAHMHREGKLLYIWGGFLTANWHPVPPQEEKKRMIDFMVTKYSVLSRGSA